jgi:hypothetical protein
MDNFGQLSLTTVIVFLLSLSSSNFFFVAIEKRGLSQKLSTFGCRNNITQNLRVAFGLKKKVGGEKLLKSINEFRLKLVQILSLVFVIFSFLFFYGYL